MSYFSQFIVYALAVMGILFKSTKTDSEGKTLYWKHSIPMLTTTGKVVLVLITASSVISIVSARRKSATDSEERIKAEARQHATDEQLTQVRTQNQTLNEVLGRVHEQASLISAEQRTQFTSVLNEQKKTGEGIATRIGDSARLLGGRINESIDLLHHSTAELNRAVHPIKDVLVSFRVIPPRDHPVFAEYDRALKQGMKRVDLKSLPQHTRLLGRQIGDRPVLELSISQGSPLFPSEMGAVLQSLRVGIHIEFFNPAVESSRLAMRLGRKPDLAIKAVGDSLLQDRSRHSFLFYELEKGWIYLLTNSATSDPAGWERTERINSIPDLLPSQLVVRFFPIDSPRDITMHQTLVDLVGKFELESLTLEMSGGREFQFVRSMFTRHLDSENHYFFVSNFLANRPQFVR